MHYFDLPTEIRLLILTFYLDEVVESRTPRLPRMISRQFDNDLFAVLISFDLNRFSRMYRGPNRDNSWLRCILEYWLRTRSNSTPIVKHLRAVGTSYIKHCQQFGAEICSDSVWYHLSSLYIQKMAWIRETSFAEILEWWDIQSDTQSQHLDALALAAFLGRLDVFTHVDTEYWSQKSLLGPPVVSAALGQRFDTIKSILPFGISPADHVAPLIVAAWQGNVQLLKLLLRSGADVNEVHKNIHIPLNVACMKGRLECAELLIQGGADLDQSGLSGHTALNTAVKFKQTHMIALMLKAGAKVDGAHRTPPLTLAAYSGDETSLRILLEHGADVKAEGVKTGAALTCLAIGGWRETSDLGIGMAKLLLSFGADINFGNNGPPPLQAAARSGNNALVEFLLDLGADINPEGSEFDPPLSYAVQAGRIQTAELLLDRGANINAHRRGRPTAIAIAAYKLNPQEKMLELLMKAGADMSMNHSAVGTPLSAAACRGHDGLVRLFLDRGADVNACDRDGGTALHRAAKSGHETTVRILVEAGSDVNARGGTFVSCLRAAAYLGHKGVMELLLGAGADIFSTAHDPFDPSVWGFSQEQVARGEELIQFFLSLANGSH